MPSGWPTATEVAASARDSEPRARSTRSSAFRRSMQGAPTRRAAGSSTQTITSAAACGASGQRDDEPPPPRLEEGRRRPALGHTRPGGTYAPRLRRDSPGCVRSPGTAAAASAPAASSRRSGRAPRSRRRSQPGPLGLSRRANRSGRSVTNPPRPRWRGRRQPGECGVFLPRREVPSRAAPRVLPEPIGQDVDRDAVQHESDGPCAGAA